MKKKLLVFTAFLSFFTAFTIPCKAMGVSAAASVPFADAGKIFSAFAESSAAVGAGIFAIAVLLLFVLFGKKITKKLAEAKPVHMLNAFIVFFAVSGIACLGLAFATEGETWSAMMYTDHSQSVLFTQFSDYILTMQNCHVSTFIDVADRFSPFSLILYLILAQFMPSNYLASDSMIIYQYILRHQTFMYMYLIMVMALVVLMYRMNREKLRSNGIKLQNEIIVFMTVVSYPTFYCIERGNIIGLSLALAIFFFMFNQDSKKLIKELSHIAMGISAAIFPPAILFVLLLVRKNKKLAANNIIKILIYFVILTVFSSFITGFDSLALYFGTLFSIPASPVTGNMSISNALLFWGLGNQIVLHAITIIADIIALVCIFVCSRNWQKMAAVIFIMLNTNAVSEPTTLIFVFIPFVYLLAETQHKPLDWLYLLCFTLLITPFPVWFYGDMKDFSAFMSTLGVDNIQNANYLIAPAAVCGLLVVLLIQLAVVLKSKKKAVPDKAKK